VTRTATVTPVSTGTWAPQYGGWGRFNADRGTDILYQGGGDIGAGLLRGAAFYGDRVRALGATAITHATVHLIATGYNSGSWGLLLQGTAQNAQPSGDVTLTGGQAGTTIAGTTEMDLDITEQVEAMRTGSVGGLALVGGSYGAVYGTSRGTGMALNVTYTREA
jgi:hypothetical protein